MITIKVYLATSMPGGIIGANETSIFLTNIICAPNIHIKQKDVSVYIIPCYQSSSVSEQRVRVELLLTKGVRLKRLKKIVRAIEGKMGSLAEFTKAEVEVIRKSVVRW